ncbi:hypothetical protein ACP4OV_023408 [Aristida adscensionis]
MELSTRIGGSLATPAAMALVRSNPKMTNLKCALGLQPQHRLFHRLSPITCSMVLNTQPSQSSTENPAESSVSFNDFCVSVCAEEDGVIKIRVTVSGTLTDSIFDKVFTKSVSAAQPLPGFRRKKGVVTLLALPSTWCYLNCSGKNPDIPKEVALHLIGPSKVKKETIKKIINKTVAEYVQKEGLNASKNLKVQQSYEELEAAFEPGQEFCFDAAVHLQAG